MKHRASYISRKFKFSNLQLAYDVRLTVFNALKKYDFNINSKFEQNQLRKAIIEILGEDENQVHYAVKNVLRYDKNADGTITYDQFTNFCVEQHFGEMAIQRLHRKGYYSRGNKRIMNYQEFQKTLDYCFSFINIKATSQELQRLFGEVDLDSDGWIRYEDYFIFLKEYFGSKSQAYHATSREMKGKSHHFSAVITKTYAPGQSPQERFARLIFTQLRISVLERDANYNLILERDEVEQIIDKVFKIDYYDQPQIISAVMDRLQQISYENLMKKLVMYYFCEYYPSKSISYQRISAKSFINHIEKAANFISIRPSQTVLQEFFNRVDTDQDGQISRQQYINSLKSMLEKYKFDTRGLPSIQRVPSNPFR